MKLAVRDLADADHCLGKGMVLGILKKHSVKMRGQGIPHDQLDEAVRLYRGFSLKHVAIRLDCAPLRRCGKRS
jgi:hypothetical protein